MDVFQTIQQKIQQFNQSKRVTATEPDPLDHVMQNYDKKLKSEQERALNQKASHEVNQGLRDFELSKNQTIQLQKVKLHSIDSFREETFNDLVNRQIHDDDSQSEQ